MKTIEFRALTAAMFQATGRVAEGGHRYEATTEGAYALLDLADRLDTATQNVLRDAARVTSALADMHERTAREGLLNAWNGPLSFSTVGDLQAEYAKVMVMTQLYGDLFAHMAGISFGQAVTAVRAQMPIVESASYDRPWIAEAAGVIRLATAMMAQARDIENAEKAAREAALKAEREAAEAAKAAAAAQRRADRKAAKKAAVAS